ncbi:ATP-grasp domain-containing protein [Streptomyces albireticuli]|uniref:ATP-grasp domain-containing protein n=1 Tax=Streptomyces albireticuli TaxID=1940 RepID=UPI0036A33505
MALLLLNRRPILAEVPDWLSGESVVVVTAKSAAPASAYERFRRVEVVDDYESGEVDLLVDAMCAEHDVDRVLTTAEIDVVRAARARERHGIPGQSTAAALAYRDKYRMKLLASRRGIPVAPMALVRDENELSSFADRNGLPVVVKPADGAGSVGVTVLADRRAVAAFSPPAGRTLLVERFIDGIVCHVDGLMAGGALLHALPSRYLESNLDTATRAVPSISGMLPPDDGLAKRLIGAAEATVAALPPVAEVTAFHAEFFLTPQDELVLCEIACRPGGCGIAEAFELTTGINLFAAHLRGQAGLITSVTADSARPRHGWGWFPPCAGTLERMPRSCPLPGTVRYTPLGERGSRYEGPGSSTDRIAELVFRVDGGRAVEDVLREVDDWWAGEIRWQSR